MEETPRNDATTAATQSSGSRRERACEKNGHDKRPSIFPSPDLLWLQFELGSRYFHMDVECQCAWCFVGAACKRMAELSSRSHLPVSSSFLVKDHRNVMTVIGSGARGTGVCVSRTMAEIEKLVEAVTEELNRLVAKFGPRDGDSGNHRVIPSPDLMNRVGSSLETVDAWVGFACDSAGSALERSGTTALPETPEIGERTLVGKLLQYQRCRHDMHRHGFHDPPASDQRAWKFLFSRRASLETARDIVESSCQNPRCLSALSRGLADGTSGGMPAECVAACAAAIPVLVPRVSVAILEATEEREIMEGISSLVSLAITCARNPATGFLPCVLLCYSCIRIATSACELRGWATACLSIDKSRDSDDRLRRVEDAAIVRECCSVIECCCKTTSLACSRTDCAGTGERKLNGHPCVSDVSHAVRAAAMSALSSVLDRSARIRHGDINRHRSCDSLMESISRLCHASIEMDHCVSPPENSQQPQELIEDSGDHLDSVCREHFSHVHDTGEWESEFGGKKRRGGGRETETAPYSRSDMHGDASAYAALRGHPRCMATANMFFHKMKCGASAASCMVSEDVEAAARCWSENRSVFGPNCPSTTNSNEVLEGLGTCACACSRFFMLWKAEDERVVNNRQRRSAPNATTTQASRERENDFPWLNEKFQPAESSRASSIGDRDVFMERPKFTPDVSERRSDSSIPTWVDVLANGAVEGMAMAEDFYNRNAHSEAAERENVLRRASVALLGSGSNNGGCTWADVAAETGCMGRWKRWLTTSYTSVSWTNVKALAKCISEGRLVDCVPTIVHWLKTQCGWASAAVLLNVPAEVINARGKAMAIVGHEESPGADPIVKVSSDSAESNESVQGGLLHDVKSVNSYSSSGGVLGGIASSFASFLQKARNAPMAERLRSIDGREGAIPLWMDDMFRESTAAAMCVSGMPKYEVEREESCEEPYTKVFVASRTTAECCREVLELVAVGNESLVKFLDELGAMISDDSHTSDEQDKAFSVVVTYVISAVKCALAEGVERSERGGSAELPSIEIAKRVVAEATKAYVNCEDKKTPSERLANARGGLSRTLLVGLRTRVRYVRGEEGTGGIFVDRGVLRKCAASQHWCQHEGNWISGTCGTIAASVAKSQKADDAAAEMEMLCSFTSMSLQKCHDRQALVAVDSGFVTAADGMLSDGVVDDDTRAAWASCLECVTLARIRDACNLMQQIISSSAVQLSAMALNEFGRAITSASTVSTLLASKPIAARCVDGGATSLGLSASAATKYLCIALNSLLEVSCVILASMSRQHVRAVQTYGSFQKAPSLSETTSSSSSVKTLEEGTSQAQDIQVVMSLELENGKATEVLKNAVTIINSIVDNDHAYGSGTFRDEDKFVMAVLVCSPAFTTEFLSATFGIKLNGEIHDIVRRTRMSQCNASLLASGSIKIMEKISKTELHSKTVEELKATVSRWLSNQKKYLNGV